MNSWQVVYWSPVNRSHAELSEVFRLNNWYNVTNWMLLNYQMNTDVLLKLCSQLCSSLECVSSADLWRVCCPIAHCATTRTDSQAPRLNTKKPGQKPWEPSAPCSDKPIIVSSSSSSNTTGSKLLLKYFFLCEASFRFKLLSHTSRYVLYYLSQVTLLIMTEWLCTKMHASSWIEFEEQKSSERASTKLWSAQVPKVAVLSFLAWL